MADPRPLAAITGMGCICALGSNLEECRAGLFKGERRASAPSRFPCRLDKSYPVFEAPPRCFARARPDVCETALLARAAARQAVEAAGLRRADLDKAGVAMGTTVGATPSVYRLGDEPAPCPEPDAELMRLYVRSNPALAVALDLGAGGPVQCVANACTSGADAVGLAASLVHRGDCPLMVAGGADALSEMTYYGFIRLMNSDPNPCRPFDRNRAGLNLGEGAAALVLERADAAGDRALGYVMGYGSCSDAHHLTAPEPNGAGLAKALDQALDAGKAPALVSAHGTGTRTNDLVEARIVSQRFPGVPFFASKGMTGHTLGAAGAMEAVFTIMALDAGRMPPSPGFSEPDPELGVAPAQEGQPVRGRLGVSLSLGFGGGNAALVLAARGAS